MIFRIKTQCYILSILALIGLARAVRPHGSSSVPRGDSSGNYTGPYRPQVHFSPPQDFMNDPNGLFLDANGTYHLYYQYNPSGLEGGDQHWGHATSTDLYHWTNQPIAISPPSSDTQVYTGSAVLDVNNTSGFFPNQTNGVVAIYTLNNSTSPGLQTQEIAYSLDGGFSFQRYAGNPVINVNSNSFRDPKVIWHAETQRWVMVVAHSSDVMLSIYTSQDLKAWTLASNFTGATHPSGAGYECPNLVPMPARDLRTGASTPMLDEMYVLTVGVSNGGPNGGSAIAYFPGTFNGTHFTPVDDDAGRFTDIAKDSYAGQFWYNVPAGEDPLSIAWASNLQYAGSLPTAQEGWRSTMSLPRRNSLMVTDSAGWTLVSYPADLTPVLGAVLAHSDNLNDEAATPLEVDYSAVESNAVFLTATMSADATLSFNFSNSLTGESVSGGFTTPGEFFLDRGETKGFADPNFTANFSTSVVPLVNGTQRLAVVVDRSIVEVFINGGEYSGTATFFATQPLNLLTLSSSGSPGDALVSVTVHALNSTWA